jgi:hypothetical protein
MKTLDKTEVSSIQGVAGGETLVVFITACVRNVRSHSWRAWPSALSSTGSGCGARVRTPVCGDCIESMSCDRMGRFCGDHMGSVSGDRVGRLICYTETKSTR